MNAIKFTLLMLVLGLVGTAGMFGVGMLQENGHEVAMGAAVLTAMMGTLLAFLISYRGLKKPGKAFVGAIMGSVMLKLAVGLIAVVVMVQLDRDAIQPFVWTFFGAYIVFTAFEVYGLMRNLRAENQEGFNNG